MRTLPKKPSPLQKKILQLIARKTRNGHAELSYSDIANLLKTSKSNVQKAIKLLVRKELIEIEPGRSHQPTKFFLKKEKYDNKEKDNSIDCDRRNKNSAHAYIKGLVDKKTLPKAKEFKCFYCLKHYAAVWHHSVSYKREYWGAVIPTCRSCHKYRHNNNI